MFTLIMFQLAITDDGSLLCIYIHNIRGIKEIISQANGGTGDWFKQMKMSI